MGVDSFFNNEKPKPWSPWDEKFGEDERDPGTTKPKDPKPSK